MIRNLARWLAHSSKWFARKNIAQTNPQVLERGWYEISVREITDQTKLLLVTQESRQTHFSLGQPVSGVKKRKLKVTEKATLQLRGPGKIVSIALISSLAGRLLSTGRLFIQDNRTTQTNIRLAKRLLFGDGQIVNHTLNMIADAELDLFFKLKQLLKNLQRPKVKVAVLGFNKLNDAEAWHQLDYVLLSDEPVTLHAATEHSFNYYLDKLSQATRPAFVYSDHINSRGEVFAKPDLNLPFLYCADYVGPALFVSTSFLKQISIETIRDRLTLFHIFRRLASDRPYDIAHIPQLLLCSDGQVVNARTTAPLPWPLITQHTDDNGICKLTGDVPSPAPFVSIIIPSRDNTALLKRCIESILALTQYPEFEIIIVDNHSQTEEALRYFDSLHHSHITVLRYPHPFNYSAINNFAVHHARGDYIALLNDDIEVKTHNWLNDLMAWAAQENVGAVGAKLFYPDGRIQHAGLTIGMGHAAGHTHRFEDGETCGYLGRLCSTQQVKAVTAACLVVEKHKFNLVNGLDEREFAIAYNDVDLCLKLDKLGYQNILCVEAELIHYESVSRGSDLEPEKQQRYRRELKKLQRKWHTRGYTDPFFSPLLPPHSETVIAPTIELTAFSETPN
ncbi:glycosyltransferase family 2 protein [Aestuariibacter salexigens]|uniref:glycosyltransferase family 2 protein n=1 Tax=Aestuariibacter salexigens TaxID=226010 RepID=UPI0003FC3EB1|nr:glycosyltransferase family 2 protein [Aestuariibacter salexigens]